MLPSKQRSYATPPSALLTAKPLGSDGLRAHIQIEEMTAHGFHEWIGAAHERQPRRSCKPPQRRFEQRLVNPAADVLRPTCSIPRQAQLKSEFGIGCIARDQLLAVDHIIPGARRLKQKN